MKQEFIASVKINHNNNNNIDNNNNNNNRSLEPFCVLGVKQPTTTKELLLLDNSETWQDGFIYIYIKSVVSSSFQIEPWRPCAADRPHNARTKSSLNIISGAHLI